MHMCAIEYKFDVIYEKFARFGEMRGCKLPILTGCIVDWRFVGVLLFFAQWHPSLNSCHVYFVLAAVVIVVGIRLFRIVSWLILDKHIILTLAEVRHLAEYVNPVGHGKRSTVTKFRYTTHNYKMNKLKATTETMVANTKFSYEARSLF